MAEETKEEKREEKKEEKVVESRKNKIFSWFKKKENTLLFLILLLAIAIRLYFFFKTAGQAVWWDEADYLIRAKYYATGLVRFEEFSPRKPFLMSMFWGGLNFFGANELVLRITEFIFSMLGIYLTFLIGKKLFNYKVGLIASLLLTVWWSHLFYTYRLLLDVPIIVFGLASIYFFYEWYQKQKFKHLIICAIITAIGIMVHYYVGLLPLAYLIFLIFTKRSFFKSKQFLLTIVLAFIALSPFLIWMWIQFGNPLHPFLSFFQTSPLVKGFCDPGYPCGWGGYLTNIPTLFGLQFFALFAVGLVAILINILLSFDFIVKDQDKKYHWDLFVLIAILIIVSFLATVQQNFEDRYMFLAMPLIFFIAAKGTLFIYDSFKKYGKIIVISVLIALFLWGGYLQLQQASSIIESKRTSYIQLKHAGEWMKENIDENSIIFTTSNRHLLYYSERNVFLTPAEHLAKNSSAGCYEMANDTYYGQLVVEKKELKSLELESPISSCYFALTIFEPSTPDWVYSWPQDYQEDLEPIQAWFFDPEQEQPAIILYELKR